MEILTFKKGIYLLVLSLFMLNLEASWFNFSSPIVEQTCSQKIFESVKEYGTSILKTIKMHPFYTLLGVGILGTSFWYMTKSRKKSVPEYYDLFGNKVDDVNNYHKVINAVNKHLPKYTVANRKKEKTVVDGDLVITLIITLIPREKGLKIQKLENDFYVDERKFLFLGTETFSNEINNKLIVKQAIKVRPLTHVQNTGQIQEHREEKKKKVKKNNDGNVNECTQQ